jgi:hypothetical protein
MRKLWQLVRAVVTTLTPARRRDFSRLNLEPLESRQVLSVSYHGGPLLQSVQVESVYYGQAWTTDPTLQQTIAQTDTFFQYLVTSPYMAALGQYNVAAGSVLNDDIVNQNPAGQTISNTQIQQALNAEITAGRLAAPNSNTMVVFFTAPGVVVTANGQNSVNDFAAYHDVLTDAAGATVYYAVVPYPTGNIAPTSATLTAFQQETIALSHEVAETATDPDTQSGWLDPQGNEICDLANGQFGTLHGYLVAGFWSQADSRIVIPTDTSGANLAVNNAQLQAGSGVSFTGIVATITDSEPNATAGNFTTTIDWGDGTSSTGTVILDPNGEFDIFGMHTYASRGSGFGGRVPRFPGRGTGPYEVDVTIQNTTDSAVALAVSSATVSATPPNLVATGQNINATVGTAFSGTVATSTDADGDGAANFTATIVWGDGASSAGTITANAPGGFLVSGAHTYASSGSDALFVTIHDADGTSAVALGTATVAQLSPFQAVALGFLQSGEYESDLVTKNYQQYLGRTPSNAEVAYWVHALSNGATDAQVLASFLSSPEFYLRAGSSNKAWVDALYLDLLGRPADLSGESHWLQQLAAGFSLHDVALDIVNSQEHERLVVQADYQQYLGRTGGGSEVAYWVNTMQQGATETQVLANFLSSGEYYTRAGNTDNGWIDSLYQHLLNRTAGSSEESYWLQVLTAAGG